MDQALRQGVSSLGRHLCVRKALRRRQYYGFSAGGGDGDGGQNEGLFPQVQPVEGSGKAGGSGSHSLWREFTPKGGAASFMGRGGSSML